MDDDGWISYKGDGKLVFITGKMAFYSYFQLLKYYQEDIKRFDESLYFQQDNAPYNMNLGKL